MDFARAARERDALRHLRVLVLCDFGLAKDVVLRALSSFPALRLVGVVNSKTGSMRSERGDGMGWKEMWGDQ